VTLAVADFVAGLPKAELHVHLQGAASVETVLELSRRHPEEGLPQEVDEWRDLYRFRDFDHFISVYLAVNRLVQEPEDVRSLVVGLARDLAAVNARYAEITVTVDSHLQSGISAEGVSWALENGREQALALHGVDVAFVYDINGGDGVPAAERTIAWAETYLPAGSVGFGLGGPEVDRSMFVEHFRRADRLGLASVPHAGEVTGPESMWISIEQLGAVRIGHGIAAAQDPRLLATLVERGIVLEVCPTSNLRTAVVASIEDHPFPVLRDAGVRLTLNTDDPGMFDTDLNREYVLAHDVFGVDRSGLVELAREAVRASLAPATAKARLLAEIDDYAGTALPD
jgi:aminodeoxyfutalosine deaminase